MPAKLNVFGVCVGTIIPIAFACGGGDDGGKIQVISADASIDAMEPCKGQMTYAPGAIGSDSAEATDYPAMGSGEDASLHEIFMLAALDSNTPGDYLYIDLYEMFGAFEGGPIATGTFTLTGDDSAYSTCGACVMLGAQVDDAGNVDDWYFARSGILNLTSVTTRLTGSLQNVMLYRVRTDADGNPSDDATFDCETKITSASFDLPITVDTGSAASDPHTPF
jgi:hypothetical protein